MLGDLAHTTRLPLTGIFPPSKARVAPLSSRAQLPWTGGQRCSMTLALCGVAPVADAMIEAKRG